MDCWQHEDWQQWEWQQEDWQQKDWQHTIQEFQKKSEFHLQALENAIMKMMEGFKEQERALDRCEKALQAQHESIRIIQQQLQEQSQKTKRP